MAANLTLAQRTALMIRKRSADAKAHEIERKFGAFLGGALLGMVEGKLPVALGPVPIKPALVIGLAWGATQASGSTRRWLNTAADSTAAVYGYLASKNKTLIAGDDSIAGEGSEL